MRKSVLAVMAAGSVFALTAAGAAVLTTGTIGSLAVSRSASVNVTVTDCPASISTILVPDVGASSDFIDRIQLVASSTACNGRTGTVSYDAGDTSSDTFDGFTADIDLDPNYSPGTSFSLDITVN